MLSGVQATASSRSSPAGVAAALLDLWQHLMRGGSGEFFAILEELDLSLTQLKTLEALSACPSELSVKELSGRLGFSLPSASRTVDALLRRGWLERREDERDRRVRRVRLTEPGREVVRRLDGARLQSLERFTAGLDDEQRARLADALSRLTLDRPPA